MNFKKATSLFLSVLIAQSGLGAGAMMPPPQKRICRAEASEAPATSVDTQIYNIACRARELLVQFVTDPDLPVISNQKVFETSNGAFCTMGNPNSPVIPTEKQIENIQDIYEVVRDYYSTAPIEFRQKVADLKNRWFAILRRFYDISSEAHWIVTPQNHHPNYIYAHLTNLFLDDTFKGFLPDYDPYYKSRRESYFDNSRLKTQETARIASYGTTGSIANALHGQMCSYCYERPFGTYGFLGIFQTLFDPSCSNESFLTALIQLNHHYKINIFIYDLKRH